MVIPVLFSSAPRYERPRAAAGEAAPVATETVELSGASTPGVSPQQVAASQRVAVLVAGAGNAGLTAALYTARAQLDTLVVGSPWGSALAQSADVENFPGYKRSPGMDIVESQRVQAEESGARFLMDNIVRIEGDRPPFRVHMEGGEVIEAETVILATGARARRLGAPGEDELFGKGVSTCATCDGNFYKGRNVVIVGGGDTAVGDALHMSKLAARVTVVHRRGEFRAEKVLQERLSKASNVELAMNTEVERIVPSPSGGVGAVELISHPDGAPSKKTEGVTRRTLEVDGVFVAVGHLPNTEFLAGSGVELNKHGHIVTHDYVATSVPGIFAAGDATDVPYYQASVASGFGAIAGLKAIEFVEGK